MFSDMDVFVTGMSESAAGSIAGYLIVISIILPVVAQRFGDGARS